MSSILPSSLTSGSSSSGTSSGTTPSSGGVVTSTGAQGVVTSTGLGSGLDINSIVTQLVAAEGAGPSQLLASQSNAIQTKLSAYGQLQSAVAALQGSLTTLATTAQFKTNGATVGDNTVASASADGTAVAGSYSLEVDQLATGAQLTSTPFAAASTAVGTGTLTIKVGAAAIPITIDSTNNTLAGIASAINTAGAAHGVSASLLTATDGVRLVLSSATTGAANAVTVTSSGGDGGLAALAYDPANSNTKLTLTQAAQDAQIKLNGFAYNSASNNVSGALTGVTISLKAKTANGATTPLTIAVDQSSAQQAVQSFVSSYNTYAAAVAQLSSYDAATSSAGPLLGDGLLNSLVSQVNRAIDTSVGSLKGGPFTTLAEIGITANVDGTLGVDSSKLSAAFSNNYAAVTQLFAGSDGVGVQLNNLLNEYTQPSTGVFAEQTTNLQSSLSSIATQKTALNQRLATLQTTLFAQYNAMDQLVAQLKSTGTTVNQELSSIYYPGKASTAVP
ncbi:MAG TPA: flagellar filament capping protein FliD [Steroidobacteraceae bacterium]|nr:flagellar filament capping protein FliD [Steroidobacteraceae bacterium]